MNRYASLLLALDGSQEAAKSAGCALWLAQALGATLHVVHATTQPVSAAEALEQLRIPDAQRPDVVLHQVAENADATVLSVIRDYGVGLVMMSTSGASASTGINPPYPLGSVAQAVIERSPVPVLLFPLRYRAALPWTSMLAATSGETAAEQALDAATQLAAALRIRVTVVHAEDGSGTTGSAPLGTYSDAAHHEYPSRFDEMMERGLAGCTREECQFVDQALLCRGDPATVLLHQVAHRNSSVLALGWHGAFGPGRALVLKRLLEQATCALLLVRGAQGSSARLKVGEEFDD